ncbi:hypothetical protein [Streptomyces beihaiensis]|uniref:Uncharacterized protein n=1 Tax=Streptomyces beihaiensis TaxID=2984495 RepID=A0ABT3TTP2_9ACTN|nr:hypothetical protein [Streptomyces beihaiensis]MCX3060395.1 hypothetical protein [Streptomyces beihaiensis]
MKALALLTVVVVLVVWLVWNAWNVFRVVVGARDGSWRRPMWWTRLCSIALFVGAAAWTRGVFAAGLDTRKTCLYTHHVPYDTAYRDAHADEFRRLFPLHNKCDAHFDLVPGWVNPTVVAGAVVALAAAAVLLWFATTYVIRLSRKENQSS